MFLSIVQTPKYYSEQVYCDNNEIRSQKQSDLEIHRQLWQRWLELLRHINKI